MLHRLAECVCTVAHSHAKAQIVTLNKKVSTWLQNYIVKSKNSNKDSVKCRVAEVLTFFKLSTHFAALMHTMTIIYLSGVDKVVDRYH